jgi:polyisoprenoid-binding protein YceI
MRLLAAALCLALAVSGCALTARQDLQTAGAGAYQLELPHASVIWRVKHLGLSHYTARFTRIEASLDFDPARPEASRVKAIIDPLSVRAEHPTDANWDRQIGGDILKGTQFPQIIFESTSIERTGEFTGRITGNLTFAGVTKPVVLDATFNGALNASPLYRGRDAVGFSARTTFKRSDFGVSRYAAFVGDEVEVIIEAEFTRTGNTAP